MTAQGFSLTRFLLTVTASLFFFSFFFSLAAFAGTPLFETAPTYVTGPNPLSVAVGDFNHDGIPDLAVANAAQGNSETGSVSILIGTGSGTFLPAVKYAFPNSYVGSVAVGDFNGDGNLDVAAGYQKGLGILLGNGDGTFRAPTTYGTYAGTLAVGDFNGDHILDVLALAGYSVILFAGNGDGSFRSPTIIQSFKAFASSLAVGDFNRDGVLDFAVVAADITEGTFVYLGNGDGTFTRKSSYQTGNGVLAAADFNGDGIPDLAVAGTTSIGFSAIGNVEVLLGNGDGTFNQLNKFVNAWDPAASCVLAADFNHDGKIDLALVNDWGDDVSILLGNGDGTFATATDWTVDNFPYFAGVGDFNHDGNLDLVVSNFEINSVSVLLGTGNGTFKAAPAASVGPDASFLAAADFNGDGKPDLAVVNTNSGSLGILLSNGDGTFQPAVNYNAQDFPTALAVGDLNGDHIQDVAVLNTCSNSINCSFGTISIFLGNGDGTFRTLTAVSTGGVAGPISIASADFNGDGNADLLVGQTLANGLVGISLLLSKGDGTFQKPVTIFQNFFAGGNLALGDFNHDGKADFATTSSSSVVVFLGNGDGTFHSVSSPVKNVPFYLAAADVNNDGNLDLIGSRLASPGVIVMLGNGDGTFQADQTLSTGSTTDSSYATSADFNGDGKPDLAVINIGGNYGSPANIAVLLGNGDGTFESPSLFSAGGPYALAADDFNSDGKPDLAVANGNGNNVIILLNTGK
jgi:hypothetical protein